MKTFATLLTELEGTSFDVKPTMFMLGKGLIVGDMGSSISKNINNFVHNFPMSFYIKTQRNNQE